MRQSWMLLVIFSAALHGQRPAANPMAGNPKETEQGRAVFRIYCSPCHGIRADGGRGPDLTRGAFVNGDRDRDLFRVIGEGVTGTEMPGFGVVFDDDNIWRLIAFIRSTARPEAASIAGDRRAGETLFWNKGGCGQCHTVGARGRAFGPDLSRAGRQRSLAYLRESVLEPNNDLTAGYATITVVTREGKTITGVQKAFDNFSAQLVDAAGNYYSFEKSGAASVKREFRSLMPGRYGKLFSPSELDDLLAYLASLRGQEVSQ